MGSGGDWLGGGGGGECRPWVCGGGCRENGGYGRSLGLIEGVGGEEVGSGGWGWGVKTITIS